MYLTYNGYQFSKCQASILIVGLYQFGQQPRQQHPIGVEEHAPLNV